MITAFIAGATGYTGRHVTERLAREGVRAIAHVRPDSPARGSWMARFAAAGAESDCTPWSGEEMARTMARLRPDIVFALLGTTRSRAARDERATGASAGGNSRAMSPGIDAPGERRCHGRSTNR